MGGHVYISLLAREFATRTVLLKCFVLGSPNLAIRASFQQPWGWYIPVALPAYLRVSAEAARGIPFDKTLTMVVPTGKGTTVSSSQAPAVSTVLPA